MIEQGPQAPSVPAESAPPPQRAVATRRALMAFMLITATVVGVLAGLLAHAAGKNIPEAILSGGGAFAGTAGLLVAMAHYAGR
ncbi:hypothetical protein Apa02nite_081700 [Actinoplanes palleronii]|uniref:ZIP family metal transporter n=2 Tax=Actinoplanes palleronii TaxID=113570 RepID=A0ABQ4BMZ2_9ACTN|nr:hypothetical protein Apa02nite_081700 [Actinoplanes palleronii]